MGFLSSNLQISLFSTLVGSVISWDLLILWNSRQRKREKLDLLHAALDELAHSIRSLGKAAKLLRTELMQTQDPAYALRDPLNLITTLQFDSLQTLKVKTPRALENLHFRRMLRELSMQAHEYNELVTSRESFRIHHHQPEPPILRKYDTLLLERIDALQALIDQVIRVMEQVERRTVR